MSCVFELVGAVFMCNATLAVQDTPARVPDVTTVENANEDFTKLSLEELVTKDVTVYERLKATRELALQQGVLAAHVHNAGETMIGYRFSLMQMEGNRTGSRNVSDAEVLGQFMVSPTDMSMKMHMVHFMRAPSDNFTWMVMVPFKDLSMNHVTQMGGTFRTQSVGMSDVSFTGIWTFLDLGEKTKLVPTKKDGKVGDSFFQPRKSKDGFIYRQHHAHFGLTGFFPTGSINQRGTTPMGPNQLLPYPMQLGSGTFDVGPSLTYSGVSENWGWGFSTSARIRLGKNYRGYSLGDQTDVQTWLTKKLTRSAAVEFRLHHIIWDNIDGVDAELNPLVVPTARTDLRGGSRTDFVLSLQRYIDRGRWQGNRCSVDFRLPIFQHLDGPQLQTDWGLSTNWSRTW